MSTTTTTRRGRTGLQTAEQSGEQVRGNLDRLGQSPSLRRGDPLAVMAASRRMFAAVLATACTRHGARAGVPCWTLPSGVRVGDERAALCGRRVAVVVSEQTGGQAPARGAAAPPARRAPVRVPKGARR